MDRDKLIATLMSHDFGADRFGRRTEVVFGTIDSPVAHVKNFGQVVTAGTRRFDANIPIADQFIEEVASDLEQLAWGTDEPLKYGIFVYNFPAADLVRYAKVASVSIRGCESCNFYEALSRTQSQEDL